MRSASSSAPATSSRRPCLLAQKDYLIEVEAVAVVS